MKKFILISALLALSLPSKAQTTASFAAAFEYGPSFIKSSEFWHFNQAGGQFGVDLEQENGDMLFLGIGLNLGICSDKFLNIGKDVEKLVFCPLYAVATYDYNDVLPGGGLYLDLRGGLAFGGLPSIIGSKVNSGYFAIGAGIQTESIGIGLEYSIYPGITSTIDGYTVKRDSAGSNLALKFKYRFGENRF